MLKKFIPILIALALLLAACQAAESSAPDKGAPSYGAPGGGETGGFAEEPAFEELERDFDGSAAPSERIVIRNADVELVVTNPGSAMNTISQMADEMGGYVVSATLSQYYSETGEQLPRASVSIRVPAERLNEALVRIRGLSDQEPNRENVTSQDVTREYTDLQSRLRNLEAAEQQLLRILEDANRTEDVLNVFNQLTQVREQIEVIKGQIQYYEQAAALSQVSVELIASAAVQPITPVGWEPVGVVRDAIRALITALQALVNILIWLGLFLLPILLIIILPIFILVRVLRARSRRNRNLPAATPPA